MKKKNYIALSLSVISVFGISNVTAQTLRGTVTDAISGEPLIGAAVRLVQTDKGAATDIDGSYRIEPNNTLDEDDLPPAPDQMEEQGDA